MSTMYAILAVAGWIWACLFFATLAVVAYRRRRSMKRPTRGFEVVTEHDEPRRPSTSVRPGAPRDDR
jgi:hypothetical protein